MASHLIEILGWKNKQESGMVFLSLNLLFYLVVLGGYSILSLSCSVLAVFTIVVNVHRFLYKTSAEEDGDYLYVSREALENLFVMVYEHGHCLCKKFHSSLGDSIQIVASLFVLSWLSELFGIAGLLWLATLLAFALTPQYNLNKAVVDSQLEEISKKVTEGKKTLFELIPRHKGHN